MAEHKPVNVFVAAAGNAFMTDLAGWLVDAAVLAGRDARLVSDRLPDDPAACNLVVAPHEFFVLHGGTDAELNAAAAVSVLICTEQPETPWFFLGLSYCDPAPLVYDINLNGVTALRRVGVAAEWLPLGGVPAMVSEPAVRDIDVLFLGGDTERRRAVLSTLGPLLWDRRSELRLFRFTEPVHGGVPGLVFGRDKYDLLARSRILVNVHRDDKAPGYFEWARIVEALANGTTVVTEPSAGHEPLQPGVHFVATDDIAGAVAELLDDGERCAAIGKAGAEAVLGELGLRDRLAPVLDRVDTLDVTRPSLRRRWAIRRNRPRRAPKPPLLPVFRPADPLRERVYHALLAEQDLQRRIEAVRCQLAYGRPDHDLEYASASYATSPVPEISAVVTLYNYAGVVTETLDSLAASRDVTLEIVVVDDHSTDGGRDVVRDFMSRHPELPVLLLGRENNRGLPHARNHGIERARADKVMVIDADNAVYPTCLRRLADALDADPGASFAYATLEAFGYEPGLRSHLPWHVPWLCAANYLDAQALIRRDVLERHGGYRTDDEWIYGWEDWDLWLRLASAGEHGVHLPEMLGRYRTQRTSMISMSNLAADAMRAHLRARYPELPWPASGEPSSEL